MYNDRRQRTSGIDAPVDLRAEYQKNPLGIDSPAPRLSWWLQSEARGTRQSAYQLRVAESAQQLYSAEGLTWDTGKVASGQSIQLPYAGPSLRSRVRYYWQVRVWNEGDAVSLWSEPAWWEMGLLSPTDWQAQWIAPPIDADIDRSTPSPLLRATFELSGPIARARAYVTSLGLYKFHLNGRRVGDDLFTPGWTSFEKRLQYQVYDITALLTAGVNAVGAVLGDGWYRWAPLSKHRNNGKALAFLMQLEVTYQDGRTQVITSNAGWKTASGPILRSEIYDGEVYDARLERDGWANASYDDRDWIRVYLAEPFSTKLVLSIAPPVRRIEKLTPVRILKTPAGVMVADMGQNMVGWVRLRVRGEAGTVVILRHAEVLDRDGNFYTENLRAAEQRVQYTLRGGEEECFEPHFTFQGFRYVAVEGYPGELQPGSLTGIVIHSDMRRIGKLETSNPLLNQLQRNILWSLRGNFLDVPTDCPQRNERLGWTCDAERFMPTAALNMDVAGVFSKWLSDLSADQRPDGAVPMEIPRSFPVPFPVNSFYEADGREIPGNPLVEMAGVPVYGDAAALVPWNLYLAYADTRILEFQYESMTRWVQYIGTQTGDGLIWNPVFSLGDWLDYQTTVKPTRLGATADDLIATAFYARSADILRRAATILGKQDDATGYEQLFKRICHAFRERFVSSDGRVGEGTQAGYVLALDFDLLPEALRPAAARRLAEDVRSRGHLTTGFVGTQHLLNVLSRFGHDEEAYWLLLRTQMPSWLYSVTHGATTIWERWDSIKPDGAFQTPKMNSFNHFALGTVGEWMYAVMAGIALDPEAPGYKHILIQPKPGGGLSYVKASHVTPYGEVATSWRIDSGSFDLTVSIPPNTTATVTLPNARLDEVLESGRPLTHSIGVFSMRQSGGSVVVEIGSGRYEFSIPHLDKCAGKKIEALDRATTACGQVDQP